MGNDQVLLRWYWSLGYVAVQASFYIGGAIVRR
jgi:hypothetical protein